MRNFGCLHFYDQEQNPPYRFCLTVLKTLVNIQEIRNKGLMVGGEEAKLPLFTGNIN